MSLFSDIEKTIERGFRSWTERMFGKAESDDLLMLHHAILEQVEAKVQTGMRDQRLMPFNHVVVELASPDADRRALFHAAFGDGRLEKDIREALEGARCEIPRGFAVEVECREGEEGFEVHFAQRKPVSPAAAPQAVGTVAALEVLHGSAGEARIDIRKARTNLGRLPEVHDSRQRVVRRNDVAFDDEGDINSTVSRAHAHIRHDAESGHYLLRDDGSEHGTSIFRDGRRIEVPSANRLGERLRDGDEIYLGRACLVFRNSPLQV